jgi:hypothetical protein
MKRSLLVIPVLLSSLSIATLPSLSAETRCGWLQNPTPANYSLTDRDGNWTISAQGGYHARGWDNLPSYKEGQFVRTNGNYGYSCACLLVLANRNQMRITNILGGESLPLKTCRQDPNLPKNP